jgi:hypothetical protein
MDAQTTNAFLDALETAEAKCAEAVAHVGFANYAERESEAHGWVEEAFETLRNLVPSTAIPTVAATDFASIVTDGAVTTAPIDWHKEMRTCVGDAAELADRISTTDSDVGGALGRLCNVVTHLLDDNKALAELVAKQDKRADAHMNSIADLLEGTRVLRERVERAEELQALQGIINTQAVTVFNSLDARITALEAKENP